VIEVRPLDDDELPLVDSVLPLSRLDERAPGDAYLVAWEDGEPAGHVFFAAPSPRLRVPDAPELQDLFVRDERRGRGIGSQLLRAAEREAAARGFASVVLSFGDANRGRSLYERLGYVDAGVEPVRVRGTITIRGRPLDVDDTLVYLVKRL
jgi:GNAT superfamily N-acetyltransferase